MADAVAALSPPATDCAIAVATADAVAEPQPDEDAYQVHKRDNKCVGAGCRVWDMSALSPVNCNNLQDA